MTVAGNACAKKDAKSDMIWPQGHYVLVMCAVRPPLHITSLCGHVTVWSTRWLVTLVLCQALSNVADLGTGNNQREGQSM
jgi:hypothetical protein